jgi:hypothetical protein
MDAGVRERVVSWLRRLRRLERREIRAFRAWLENTQNLIHVSVLLFVPLLMAAVTFLSGRLTELSFLLFPPLASGTYTLFSDPDGRFASPRRFVGGLTAGAVCGLIALNVVAAIQGTTVDTLRVDAGAAALAVLLAGAVTWAFDLEEPAAYSTALLLLVTRTDKLTYVLSVATSSILVAGVFLLWRDRFFDQRARYLYTSTQGDDRVLVPVRGAHPGATARLGARIAAAHDSAKVVLLGLVDPDAEAEADAAGATERGADADWPVPAADGRGDAASGGNDDGVEREAARADAADRSNGGRTAVPGPADDAAPDVDTDADTAAASGSDETTRELRTAASAMDLEGRAADLEAVYGVPCEVLVAEASTDNPGRPIVQAAHDTGCDLIVTPYETDDDDERLAPYIHELFHSDTDTLVHRSTGTGADAEGDWQDVLVPVRRAGDVAHKMIDFAARLASDRGRVSVCHCIDSEAQRDAAERMLGDLAETVARGVETRIAREEIQPFLERVSGSYDLVIIGSSGDRSTASRFVSRPTFERIEDLDCDFAVLDRNFRV